MSRSILVQQENTSQRSLLVEIIDSATSRHIYEVGSFEELAEISARQSSLFIFMELEAGNEQQLQWLQTQDDHVLGIINRRWEENELEPFISAGLSDYVLKPYQPERLIELVENLTEYFQSSPA